MLAVAEAADGEISLRRSYVYSWEGDGKLQNCSPQLTARAGQATVNPAVPDTFESVRVSVGGLVPSA